MVDADGISLFNIILPMDLAPYKLILASQSPRRSQLLESAGFDFTIKAIDVDESFPGNLPVAEVAEYIARKKAAVHKSSIDNETLVLTADTVVAFNNTIYGKPENKEHAVDILLTLSDTTHQVYTGFCIQSQNHMISETVKSDVKFGTISRTDALYYIENYDAMDKAGAYGIQDWIGDVKVEWIHGSYTNIVGLPVVQISRALKRISKL